MKRFSELKPWSKTFRSKTKRRVTWAILSRTKIIQKVLQMLPLGKT